MPLQFILFMVTLLGLVAALLVGILISQQMGLQDYLILGVVFSPLLATFILAMRRNWIAVGIGLIPLNTALPVAMLSGFGVNVMFAAMVFAMVLGGYCMKLYQTPIPLSLANVLMAVSFIFVLARIIYDRPGSALIGGSGGARQAAFFLLAYLVFWAFSKIAAEDNWNPMTVLKIIFVILIVATVWRLYRLNIVVNLYSRPSWMLSSILLAWTIFYFRQKGAMLLNIFLGGGVMFLMAASIFTNHRSRPLFALATIGVVTYLFKVHRRTAVHLVLAGIVGAITIFTLGHETMPASVKRTLSTVIPVSKEEGMRMARYTGSSEVGWESEFRQIMYDIAFEKISGNPLFGAGFEFSRADLIRMRAFGEGRKGTLALAGGYHNSILQLAVGAGIPAAIAALVAIFLYIYRAIRLAMRQTDPKKMLFLAALIGGIPPMAGQMLMNGDGKDFLLLCVLLGALHGMELNKRFKPDVKKVEAAQEETETETEQATEEYESPVPEPAGVAVRARVTG